MSWVVQVSVFYKGNIIYYLEWRIQGICTEDRWGIQPMQNELISPRFSALSVISAGLQ